MEEYTDKRIQRSKSALKQTFLTLLSIKAFEHISISEIVREANYNRGTFYANFESKENLLNEIIQDVLSDMIKEIRKPYKMLRKVNMKQLPIKDITLFQYFKDNADLFKLLLSNHIQVDFRYRIAKAIEELFLEEYEYELESDIHINPRWLYVYRSHGIAGVIIRWIEEEFPESPEYMSEQIVDLMVVATEVFYVKEK